MRTLTESNLRDAIRTLGLPEDLAGQILAAAPETKVEEGKAPRFEAAHIAYYLGALLIIGAMGWFVTSAWDTLPGLAMSGIALAYAAIFGAAGVHLYRRRETVIPGGLLATVAVCMTPLFVYGLERQMGWWPAGDPGAYTNFHPLISGSWLLMEAATILAAGAMLKFVRFPFVTAPAAYALWYMSMDATAFAFGKQPTFHQECIVSIGFGLLMMAVGFFADGETDRDFAFWFYLFGVMAFWGGLTLLGDGNQLGKAIYCLINLGLILLSVMLQRKVLLVFGAIGVFAYLAEEATRYFRNSFGFTLTLTVLGVAFIAAGVWYKRHEERLTEWMQPVIPERILRRHARLA